MAETAARSEATAAETALTVEDFLRREGEPDLRCELVGGEVRAMAPPSPRHSRIQANTVHALERRLVGRRPCGSFGEAGILVSEQDFFVADVAVSCREPGEGPGLEEPLLIVEILSPATRAHDLGTKLPAYKELPSVREIWLVDSARRWVEHWVREDGDWRGRDVIGSGELASPVLEDRISLDELYEGSGL